MQLYCSHDLSMKQYDKIQCTVSLKLNKETQNEDKLHIPYYQKIFKNINSYQILCIS